ncbi:hypothetical protein Bbelb_200340 [Branchiostoma belcheri]|nr:hypothetical protein Bbelb_200340 [Branchiostoma belcheri]
MGNLSTTGTTLALLWGLCYCLSSAFALTEFAVGGAFSRLALPGVELELVGMGESLRALKRGLLAGHANGGMADGQQAYKQKQAGRKFGLPGENVDGIRCAGSTWSSGVRYKCYQHC